MRHLLIEVTEYHEGKPKLMGISGIQEIYWDADHSTILFLNGQVMDIKETLDDIKEKVSGEPATKTTTCSHSGKPPGIETCAGL